MAAFLHIIEKSGSELPTTMKYKRENVRPPSDEAKIASGFYFRIKRWGRCLFADHLKANIDVPTVIVLKLHMVVRMIFQTGT